MLVCGALRRGCSEVGCVDLVVTLDDASTVLAALTAARVVQRSPVTLLPHRFCAHAAAVDGRMAMYERLHWLIAPTDLFVCFLHGLRASCSVDVKCLAPPACYAAELYYTGTAPFVADVAQAARAAAQSLPAPGSAFACSGPWRRLTSERYPVGVVCCLGTGCLLSSAAIYFRSCSWSTSHRQRAICHRAHPTNRCLRWLVKLFMLLSVRRDTR